MGTLKGFPNPPATLRCRQSRQAPHASLVMETLGGFASPSAPANPPCLPPRCPLRGLRDLHRPLPPSLASLAPSRSASPNPPALWLRRARARAKPEAAGWRAGRSRGPVSANAISHWEPWEGSLRPRHPPTRPAFPLAALGLAIPSSGRLRTRLPSPPPPLTRRRR
jgi:hypothetical protein